MHIYTLWTIILLCLKVLVTLKPSLTMFVAVEKFIEKACKDRLRDLDSFGRSVSPWNEPIGSLLQSSPPCKVNNFTQTEISYDQCYSISTNALVPKVYKEV